MPGGAGLIPGPGAAVCLLEDVRGTGGPAGTGGGCTNAGFKGWGVGTWGQGDSECWWEVVPTLEMIAVRCVPAEVGMLWGEGCFSAGLQQPSPSD